MNAELSDFSGVKLLASCVAHALVEDGEILPTIRIDRLVSRFDCAKLFALIAPAKCL